MPGQVHETIRNAFLTAVDQGIMSQVTVAFTDSDGYTKTRSYLGPRIYTLLISSLGRIFGVYLVCSDLKTNR